MRRNRVVVLASIVGAVLLAIGAAARAASYQDPFAYCAAVGTIDAPDARYTGEKVPPSIARGLQKAFDVPATESIEPFVHNSFWRCMDGKVYACSVGANLPCQAKADTSKTPTGGITEFCRSNPGSDFIPMVATGRETVYEWRCDGTTPAIVREMTKPDARGFVADVWYHIERLSDRE